jgi:hypothetical protein
LGKATQVVANPAVANPAVASSAVASSTAVATNRPLPAGTLARTAPQVRLAAAYGFTTVDHTGSFRVLSGTINLQSAIGNAGPMLSGQVWLDRFVAENWTLGLEYMAFRTQGKAVLTAPRGVSILTDPVYADAHVKLRGDLGFFNLAWRPVEGAVHPVLGGGIGIGYGVAAAGYYFNNAFIGALQQGVSIGKPIAGLQAFTGVDFDLTDWLYLGIMPKFVLLNGHPINVDQRLMLFGVDGILGVHF